MTQSSSIKSACRTLLILTSAFSIGLICRWYMEYRHHPTTKTRFVKEYFRWHKNSSVTNASYFVCNASDERSTNTLSILLMTRYMPINELPIMPCKFCRAPRELLFPRKTRKWTQLPKDIAEKEKLANLRKIQTLMDRHDVIVFHAIDMPAPENLLHLSDLRDDGQKFVFYTKESPYNVPTLSRKKHDDIFDWMVSYKRTGDVFAPYGRYKPTYSMDQTDMTPYSFKYKDKLAAWVVSHCGTLRDRYVNKLLKYMSIDIYGNCATRFQQPRKKCPRFQQNCEARLNRYKFIFAFENSFCNDYVTEKYWDAIARGSVPIVLGGSSYDSKLVIPNSFINVRDFKFASKLADFLHGLAKNEKLYLKLHEWRNHYSLDYYMEDRQRIEYVLQDLCAVAMSGMERERYQLSEFYSADTNCQQQAVEEAQSHLRW